MAVALYSHPEGTDLVSFSDQNFNGVGGAHRMLIQVTAQIRRLDATHNALGTPGAIALFEGLRAVRGRLSAHAAHAGGFWGMREVNLAGNGVGDEGALAGALYCARDACMRELFLQNNSITLEGVVDRVVVQLNASRLAELSLATNPLSTPAVSTLFAGLDAPHLRKLHLSACRITEDAVPAIVGFLRSPRSQRMALLELNGNSLGRLGVIAILDAVEAANFSLARIGLFANGETRWPENSDDEAEERPEAVQYPDEDHHSMAWQVGERLPKLQQRNATLTRRIRAAALRALAPTRMILHARPPSDAEIAQEVMKSTPESAPPPSFRLMDLPLEIRLHVARHCSGDTYAFTEAQWVRVRTHAEKRDTLRRLAKRRKELVAEASGESGRRYKAALVRDEWLAEVGCEWWELENKRFWDDLALADGE